MLMVAKPDRQAMTIFIPHVVLLHHILPKLPPKSVGRFRCVSKEFHEFLSSDTFTKFPNRYINHEKFLVLFNDYKEARTFGTIDCQAPDAVITPCSYKPPKGTTGIMLLTSYHGLVCIRVVLRDVNYYRLTKRDDRKNSELMLWNPMTNEHKMLSKPESHEELHWKSTFGLFYNSCEDDYKLVSVLNQSYFYMYSLKSDSWTRVSFESRPSLRIYKLSQGNCVNENLYFLNGYEDDTQSRKEEGMGDIHIGNKQYSVLRFDTKTETFTQMEIPLSVNTKNYSSATLMINKDCIHVCIMYEPYVGTSSFNIEFWKIDEDRYCKKMGTYQVDPGYMRSMKPLYLKRNGELLMIGCKYSKYDDNSYQKNCKGCLYKIDLKRKQSKVKGKDNETRCHGVEISEIVRYTETFVSPNKYTIK